MKILDGKVVSEAILEKIADGNFTYKSRWWEDPRLDMICWRELW
jgi:hypothetical protein